MKTLDLSQMQAVNDDDAAALAAYELGEIVAVDGDAGIIAAVLEGEFTWPTGADDVEPESDRVKEVNEDDDEITMTASADDPLYVVALQAGGSILAEADEISTDASLDEDGGADVESWEDIGDDGADAELAQLYHRCDNPSDPADWADTRAELIMEQQAASLADYVSDRQMNVAELEDYSVEELLNIPGVDDPEVGFASDPNGWTRKSYLDAWASVGGMWRTCYPRMIRHFGPNQAKRWCAALKDEVLQTEEWRGDF